MFLFSVHEAYKKMLESQGTDDKKVLWKKCTQRHRKNVFCVGKEKKIANIYSSNAPLPAQYGHRNV